METSSKRSKRGQSKAPKKGTREYEIWRARQNEKLERERDPDARHGRHCVFAMHVHLVFVAKYRKGVFTKEILESMNTLFGDICRDFDARLIEFNGEMDHVHLLVEYPPKVQVSKLVNSLKGVSSRKLREWFPDLVASMYYHGQLWSPSYFAGSCGGASLDILKTYIENQDTPQ